MWPRRGHGRRDKQAGQHLQQLCLAVARDAGDADDLAGPQLQPDIVEQADAARIDKAQDALPKGR